MFDTRGLTDMQMIPGVANADAFVALCYAKMCFRGKRVNLTKGLDVRVFQQTERLPRIKEHSTSSESSRVLQVNWLRRI